MTDTQNISKLRESFKEQCLSEFAFLASYGFEPTSVEEDRYGVEVTYKNRGEATGIKVSLEVRENDVFVYLIELVDGEIPSYLDAPSHWFYLHNLINLRSPPKPILRKEFGDWLTPADTDKILEDYAFALWEYGEDVLWGDFRVFAEPGEKIERPGSASASGANQIISAEELRTQRERLPAHIKSYYDLYFSELRSLLGGPGLSSEAVPDFLRGYKRIISIGGKDGVVVAHFPIELKITLSKTDSGRTITRFDSEPDATQDFYDFIAFPGSPVSNLVTFISGGEDVDIGISPGVLWGVKGFPAPQQKLDSTTGRLTWQAPWTRLMCADFNNFHFWEDLERAKGEAREDLEPYIYNLRLLVEEAQAQQEPDGVKAPEGTEEFEAYDGERDVDRLSVAVEVA